MQVIVDVTPRRPARRSDVEGKNRCSEVLEHADSVFDDATDHCTRRRKAICSWKPIPHGLKSATMSHAEILAELPKLKAEERRQIYQRLCELQEQDLLNAAGPSEEEKKLLDAALAEYEDDHDRGRPWRAVLGDLRARKAS
jgi:hypothetical protein